MQRIVPLSNDIVVYLITE